MVGRCGRSTRLDSAEVDPQRLDLGVLRFPTSSDFESFHSFLLPP